MRKKCETIAKNSEKSEKKRKNRLEIRFALFCFEAKITQIAKKVKKAKNRLEIRFALFCFEAKITQVKRSKKFEAKISEKR